MHWLDYNQKSRDKMDGHIGKLRIEQEGGSEGQGVVAGGDDGDIVSAQNDGHDGNDDEAQ